MWLYNDSIFIFTFRSLHRAPHLYHIVAYI